MSARAQVEPGVDGIALVGVVDHDSVPELLERLERGAGTGDLLRVDLEEVERMDSAGLALLLELERRQRLAGGELELRNPPASLCRLAELAEVDGLLGIRQQAEADV